MKQEVSPFIALPQSWDLYLESLERTDRKELKRKFRRLETVSHTFNYTTDAFSDFIHLHKLSDSAKDTFMTPQMELFFKDLLLLPIPHWAQKIATLAIEDKPVAAVYYFESDDSILLYNSGFDPAQKYYSVGLLLIAQLIHHAIDAKKTTFDFLRGNERYKYDLGGKDVDLYRFSFSL